MPRLGKPNYINGLRKLRDLAQMSQREFAIFLEVDHINLNNWERAKVYPRTDHRRHLCKKLGLTAPQLAVMLTTYAGDWEPPQRLVTKIGQLR